MVVSQKGWHGWSLERWEKGEIVSTRMAAIHVGPIPGRKQVAVYAIRGNKTVALAYFKHDHEAMMFLETLDLMMDHPEVEKTP